MFRWCIKMWNQKNSSINFFSHSPKTIAPNKYFWCGRPCWPFEIAPLKYALKFYWDLKLIFMTGLNASKKSNPRFQVTSIICFGYNVMYTFEIAIFKTIFVLILFGKNNLTLQSPLKMGSKLSNIGFWPQPWRTDILFCLHLEAYSS